MIPTIIWFDSSLTTSLAHSILEQLLEWDFLHALHDHSLSHIVQQVHLAQPHHLLLLYLDHSEEQL